ncbi:MAG: hypothetical protein V3G42_13135 [Oscillospiraceae bacterium]
MEVYYANFECNTGEKKVHDQIIDYIARTDTVLPAVSDYCDNPKNQSFINKILDSLRDADVFIADCTYPSLSVGYQLAYAENIGIPIHILCGSDSKLPFIFAYNSDIKIHFYKTEKDLFFAISEILNEVKEAKHLDIVDALPDDVIRVGDEITSSMGGRFFVTRIFKSGWGADYIGFSEDGKETFRSNSNNGLKKTGRHTDDVHKLDIMA